MFYFYKMQETGNDFVLIDYTKNKLDYSNKKLAEYLCNRNFGVGADGLLLIEKADKEKYRMRSFNNDGSEEVCASGIRCVAKYLYEERLIDEKEFEIETKLDSKKIKLYTEGNTVMKIEVNMNLPEFSFEKMPVNVCGKNEGKICIDNIDFYPVFLEKMHAVCFVENLDNVDMNLFQKIENSQSLSEKANIECVQIIDDNKIKMRVWKNGVGEVLSCGTSACAVASVANKYQSMKSNIRVELLGGKLDVKIGEDDICLIGTAEFVYEGKIGI